MHKMSVPPIKSNELNAVMRLILISLLQLPQKKLEGVNGRVATVSFKRRR